MAQKGAYSLLFLITKSLMSNKLQKNEYANRLKSIKAAESNAKKSYKLKSSL